jgi:hypothetical protein
MLAGLVEHQLLVPLAEKEKKRWLFVTGDIDDLLSGRNAATSFPSAVADAVIGRFCKGLIVSCTAKMKGRADFKRLTGIEEAWVLVFPGPDGGWRLFGRFARKNVFVGLACFHRDECAPLTKYNEHAATMIADWATRFASGPLMAADYDDYLGYMHLDKDET